jgi:hypothetical protein
MISDDALLAQHNTVYQKLVLKRKRGQPWNQAEREFMGDRAGLERDTFDSIKNAAGAMGLPPKLLRRAKDAGAPGFEGSRVYLKRLTLWLITWLYAAHPLSEADRIERDIKSENLRRRRFQNDVEEKQFIARADAVTWTAEMVGEFVKVMDSIPSTLAPDIVGCGSIAEAELRIRAALEGAKGTLHHGPWGEGGKV